MKRNKGNYGYIRKHYLDEIKRYVGKDIIKVIVGMRRSGKSYLLRQVIAHLKKDKQISENKIVYIDKESLAFSFIKNKTDLYNYVKERKAKYILIDEVQEVEGWEKAVASLHKEGYDVYITGSNANMLSSDLATYLAGRYITISVYGLSFKEFIQFHKLKGEPIKKAFDQYVRLGGFPILSQFQGDDEACHGLVRDIFETIIVKDVIARHKIRRVNLLHNIVHFVADNIGHIFSSNKVAQYLKSQRIQLDVETANDYLKHLSSTYAVHQVRRYDLQGKRHLEVAEKYYLGDLGLRHALIGYRPEDIGQFLENLVYLELMRRGYVISIGKLGSLEIDFIAEKAGEKIYIQVCYRMPNKEVLEREIRPLLQIEDNHPKLILSMNEGMQGASIKGVKHQSILAWMLSK